MIHNRLSKAWRTHEEEGSHAEGKASQSCHHLMATWRRFHERGIVVLPFAQNQWKTSQQGTEQDGSQGKSRVGTPSEAHITGTVFGPCSWFLTLSCFLKTASCCLDWPFLIVLELGLEALDSPRKDSVNRKAKRWGAEFPCSLRISQLPDPWEGEEMED